MLVDLDEERQMQMASKGNFLEFLEWAMSPQLQAISTCESLGLHVSCVLLILQVSLRDKVSSLSTMLGPRQRLPEPPDPKEGNHNESHSISNN